MNSIFVLFFLNSKYNKVFGIKYSNQDDDKYCRHKKQQAVLQEFSDLAWYPPCIKKLFHFFHILFGIKPNLFFLITFKFSAVYLPQQATCICTCIIMIQSLVHTRNLYCDISDLKQIFLISSSISEVSSHAIKEMNFSPGRC